MNYRSSKKVPKSANVWVLRLAGVVVSAKSKKGIALDLKSPRGRTVRRIVTTQGEIAFLAECAYQAYENGLKDGIAQGMKKQKHADALAIAAHFGIDGGKCSQSIYD